MNMLMYLGILWYFVMMLKCIDANRLKTATLSNVLKEVKNDVLGVTEMQSFFDKSTFVRGDEPNVNGKYYANRLANILRQRFKGNIQAVQKIKETVEKSYEYNNVTSSPTRPECCTVEGTTTDHRFKTKIINGQFCEIRAKYTYKGAKHFSKSLERTMKNNLENNPDLRWQYFGSQEGILSIYPSSNFSSCDSYDNRLRPWYIKGIAPEAKDIVIVVDKSESMAMVSGGKTLISIAQSAVDTVLDALNPQDRVGLVTFNSKAETPPGEKSSSTCYKNELATAVGVNLKYLKKYMRNIKTEGPSVYGNAIRKAFSLLKTNSTGSGNENARKKVILFLTDGQPTDINENFTALLTEEKKSLKNVTSKDVVIFAYGIGSGNFSLLKKIAEGTEAEGTKGRFTEITQENLDELRLVFASFYNFFARTTKYASYYITSPHFDASGLGEMVTILAPCFYKKKVIGVVGTDVVFEDLISDVQLFYIGQYSYAFLIESSTGNTIYHPNMPRTTAVNDDIVLLHITALEQEDEFNDFVLPSMMRRQEGSRNFISRRYSKIGSGGVEELLINSTYHWQAIQGTSLSFCVVLANNEIQSRLDALSTVSKKNSFVYHLEVNSPKGNNDFKICSIYGVKGTTERGTVKFSPKCFEKPYDYISLKETNKTIKGFKNYIINGRSNPEPKFVNGVRKMALAALETESIWDRNKSRFKRYTSFLTFASTNGVIYTKPGVAINKRYNPTTLSWFQNALNSKGKLTITTPYLDSFGAGLIVGVSHTLYEGKSNQQHDVRDNVIAVLDASFDMFKFYRLLVETYPECEKGYRCFLMDESGFLLIHNDFLKLESVLDLKKLAQNVGSTHITQAEQSVAADMIKRKLMYRKKCKNFKDITNKNFYVVNITTDAYVDTKQCPKYQIGRVDGTAVYLGIIYTCRQTSGACYCPYGIYNRKVNEKCLCPFKSSLRYNYCENYFPKSRDPLCPVSPPLLSNLGNSLDPPKDLHNCYNESCVRRTAEESCYGLRSCTWCVYNNETSTSLKTPYCTNSEKCYGGVQGNKRSILYSRNEAFTSPMSTKSIRTTRTIQTTQYRHNSTAPTGFFSLEINTTKTTTTQTMPYGCNLTEINTTKTTTTQTMPSGYNLTGSCLNETIGTEEAYGIFRWPKRLVRNTSYKISCPYNSKSYATRKCRQTNETRTGGAWGPIDVGRCEFKSRRSKNLFILTQTDVNSSNIVEVSRKLSKLVKQGRTLTAGDIGSTATVLEKIVVVRKKFNEIFEDIFTTIDNILDASSENIFQSQQKTNSSSRILDVLNNLAESIQLEGNNLTRVKKNYAIDLQIVHPQNFNGLSFSGTVKQSQESLPLMRNNIALNLSVRIPPDTTASLSIPKSLFEESTISNNNMNNRTAIFAFYKETKFFTTSIFQERSLFGRLNSLVIAGSIKGLTIRNLETPVEIALKEIEPGNTTSAKCSFWDFKLSNWSQEGCSFIRTLEDGRILCSCDHLTSFAMLMHIYPEKTHDLFLSIVSYIGCALSLIRSILTIIVVLKSRDLRNVSEQILVNFCIALSLTLIVFLAAVERSKTASFVACRVAAIALHYILLVALFWMAVEACNKYLELVKENPISDCYIKWCYIFAWGCPLAIVIITVATSLDQYGDNTFCRLKGVPFIIGFFTPTVIIILFNLVAFLCIIRSLYNGSDVTSDKKTSALEGIANMVLFVLTWIFGILAIGDAKRVFQYLFAIFNTLQAFFGFLFLYKNIKRQIEKNTESEGQTLEIRLTT